MLPHTVQATLMSGGVGPVYNYSGGGQVELPLRQGPPYRGPRTEYPNWILHRCLRPEHRTWPIATAASRVTEPSSLYCYTCLGGNGADLVFRPR